MHQRTCHACNQPIEPLTGCVGRFGEGELSHYHTACFVGASTFPACPICGEPITRQSLFRTIERGVIVCGHFGCVQAAIIPGAEMVEAEQAPAQPEAVASPKVCEGPHETPRTYATQCELCWRPIEHDDKPRWIKDANGDEVTIHEGCASAWSHLVALQRAHDSMARTLSNHSFEAKHAIDPVRWPYVL